MNIFANGSSFRLRQIPKHVLPIAIAAACVWGLLQRLDGFDAHAMGLAFETLSVAQWVLALIATGVSFLAVARYDVIAHRHFQTGCHPRCSTIAGATAIGLGQTLGAGAIVGSLVRWRMQPELGGVRATKIATFVAITFLSSLAVVIAFAALVLPMPQCPTWVPALILFGAGGIVYLAFFHPVLHLAGIKLTLPTLPAMGALVVLCLIDTLAAGAAFYLLLPDTVGITFLTLLPVFLIALGLAILSGTPGGVGPFELTLLTMLPEIPQPTLLAGILAFRLVYYALPAVLAGLVLLRPMTSHRSDAVSGTPIETANALSSGYARAELGVIRQNGGTMIQYDEGKCGIVRTGQTITALFDPLDSHSGQIAHPLRRMARAQNRIVCKYKITARQAVYARREGWSVLHIADEALINTRDHCLDGAPYRQLRRKLRQAEKMGVRITFPDADTTPLPEMRTVSQAWEDTHGVARGLSMGQFEETYVRGQQVVLAWQNDRLIGFITLHQSTQEWCLDLMRALPDAPDGMMHALVQRAIQQAHGSGIPCLSLSAAPARPQQCHPLEALVRLKFDKHANGPGLRQFKTCFAPRWQPLFMAAPGWGQMTFAACDLIRAVRKPLPPSEAMSLAVVPQTEPAS